MDADTGHKCGLFGVYGDWNAAFMVYQGLQALQHRGQEAAGIASSDLKDIICEKGSGLVTEAFRRHQIDLLQNPMAIGHVRYSTTGGPDLRNAQPLLVRYRGGPVAVAHNGDLTNKRELRARCEARGDTFFTFADTEILVHMLAQAQGSDFDESLHQTLRLLEGAFSLLILRPGEIHGVRDPHGFRPLSIGRLGDAWLLSSETCAFDLFGATFVRDVEPGEHVVVSESGLRSVRWAESARTSACIFEHVYFARPDSMLFGANVHRVRMRLGERLAEEHPVEADLVTAVPESGSSAAMGYARRSGIPLDRGFIKNHYVGRTFIKPSTELRQASVRLKLNAVPAVVRGKRVIVVDDSIIRGTTTHGRIRALKDAGAREVHMRVSCPPTLWPCFYGIDFPTRKELIAARLSVPEIAAFLEADSLGYLSLEGLTSCIEHGRRDYCTACFSGEYPAPVPSNAFRGEGTGRDQTS